MMKISAADFDARVNSSKTPVLVEFHSPDCAPCKRLQAVLEEYAGEMGDSIAFYGMDVSEDVEIAAQYGIMATPSMILFKDGQPKWQYSGFLAKDKIKKQVAAALR